jgi:hypothetical protein
VFRTADRVTEVPLDHRPGNRVGAGPEHAPRELAAPGQVMPAARRRTSPSASTEQAPWFEVGVGASGSRSRPTPKPSRADPVQRPRVRSWRHSGCRPASASAGASGPAGGGARARWSSASATVASASATATARAGVFWAYVHHPEELEMSEYLGSEDHAPQGPQRWQLRDGTFNANAKDELGWTLRNPSWREGSVADYTLTSATDGWRWPSC